MTPSKRRRFRSTGHRYYRKEGCSSSTPLASRCNSLPSSTTRCMLGTSSHAQAQCACPFHGLLPQGPPLQRFMCLLRAFLGDLPAPSPRLELDQDPRLVRDDSSYVYGSSIIIGVTVSSLRLRGKDAVSSTYLEADTPPTCQRTRINKS